MSGLRYAACVSANDPLGGKRKGEELYIITPGTGGHKIDYGMITNYHTYPYYGMTLPGFDAFARDCEGRERCIPALHSGKCPSHHGTGCPHPTHPDQISGHGGKKLMLGESKLAATWEVGEEKRGGGWDIGVRNDRECMLAMDVWKG